MLTAADDTLGHDGTSHATHHMHSPLCQFRSSTSTNQASTTDQSHHLTLLTLPYEIRALILRHAYPPYTIIWLSTASLTPTSTPFINILLHPRKYSLHQTCQQLRREVNRQQLLAVSVRSTRLVSPSAIWSLSKEYALSRLEKLEVHVGEISRRGPPPERAWWRGDVRSTEDVVEILDDAWSVKPELVLGALPRLQWLQMVLHCTGPDGVGGWALEGGKLVMERILGQVKGWKLKLVEGGETTHTGLIVYEASRPAPSLPISSTDR